MNKNEIINSLLEAINSDPAVIRLHELEKIIKNDSRVTELYDRMHEVEKKLVNARYYKKPYDEYQMELDDIKEKLSDIEFFDEYMDVLDQSYQIIRNVTLLIEDSLNNSIK